MTEREKVYEIFTVYGWVRISYRRYIEYHGRKRWRWADGGDRG